ASDLYSIGVILYELLTGVVPFEGETAVAIAYKQVSAEPRPPSAVNPAVPPALDAVVLRALAKDPSQRYANAEEFIAVLVRERAALGGSPGTAVLSATGQGEEGHGGEGLLAGAAAAAALMGASGAGPAARAALWGAPSAPPSAAQPPQGASRPDGSGPSTGALLLPPADG